MASNSLHNQWLLTMGVKNYYAHITIQRILNKYIKINFSRFIFWLCCCLFQDGLPLKILMTYLQKMNKILSKIWTKQLRSNFRKNFVDFWKVKRLENLVLIFPDLLTNIKKMPDSNGNPITYQSWFFKKSIIKGFCLYAVILNFYLQLLLETLKKLFLVEC